MAKKYQVFTPKDTVNQMLDNIGYSGNNIVNQKIIDISCGDGAFLQEALNRLIAACKEHGMNNSEIYSICENNIHGFEIDNVFFRDCKKNLNNILKTTLNSKKTCSWKNIHNSDGLLAKENEYDYVVGNPPYVSYKEMDDETRQYLFNNFESCKENKYDYSYAFIEKSIKLLNDNGMACIISPINMYRIKSGKLMREFLRSRLFRVIDVTEDKIFPGVLTNPVISFFKNKTDSNTIELIKNDFSRIVKIDDFYNNAVKLDENNFGKKRFGDYYSVHNGVATLLNSAFIVSEDIDVEEDILKKACSPKEIRYGRTNRIIFPYKTIDGQIIRFDENEFKQLFPKAYAFLLKNKESLEKRNIDDNTKWFEYGRSQALSTILSKKILVPAIMSERMTPILLDTNDVVYAGFFITSKDLDKYPLEEALNILSNKQLYKFIQQVGVKMNGKSYRYSVKDLENYLF